MKYAKKKLLAVNQSQYSNIEKVTRTMTLADYVKNPKRAIAAEIYSAAIQSEAEVISVLDKIEEEALEYCDIISEYNDALYFIYWDNHSVRKYENTVKVLIALKSSKIGDLIRQFVSNNTEDGLEAIKKELEQSNEFDIRIKDEWQPGRGERAYGLPKEACFYIQSVGVFYPFDKFDIDEDIKNNEERVILYKQQLQQSLAQKEELRKKYGFDACDAIESVYDNEKGYLVIEMPWKLAQFDDER
jgi:hypothetical protein